MKWFKLFFPVTMLMALQGFGQIGEKVETVSVLNVQNQTVSLPMLGQKNLLIFYADPSHPRQNKDFRAYMKAHPINNPNVDSYGVINLAAAPLLPNSMIRKMALKETQGTDAQIYFAVIFVNKDRVIEFYKAGQLTSQEQQQVLDLIKKYEK